MCVDPHFPILCHSHTNRDWGILYPLFYYKYVLGVFDGDSYWAYYFTYVVIVIVPEKVARSLQSYGWTKSSKFFHVEIPDEAEKNFHITILSDGSATSRNEYEQQEGVYTFTAPDEDDFLEELPVSIIVNDKEYILDINKKTVGYSCITSDGKKRSHILYLNHNLADALANIWVSLKASGIL